MGQLAEDNLQDNFQSRDDSLDVRGIPPSKAWLQLLQTSPDEMGLRAWIKDRLVRASLDLGRQDLSWSVDSLLCAGAGLDRFLSQVGSQAESLSGHVGGSLLNEEIARDRALRRAESKVKRAARQEAWVALNAKKGS